MRFVRAAAVSARLEELSHTGSTNDDLLQRACGADAAGWPHLSVVVTTDQRSGRGRQGRVWVAPPGSSLAASVLLRIADVPLERWGWLPLLAGTAMARAVRATLRAQSDAGSAAGSDSGGASGSAAPGSPRVTLKWPNDVLIDGRKVSGILCELLPAQSAVVVGSGVNVTLRADELPTDTSTSLLLAGLAQPDADALLALYVSELGGLVAEFAADRGDPSASGLHDVVERECDTIGRRVRVELPGGRELHGIAVGIDDFGRIRVQSEPDNRITAVAAGDVTHLRY